SAALNAVAGRSANDLWAVGRSEQTLVEHWDGTLWSVIPSPNVSTGGDILYDVSALTVNDAWAVGAWRQPGPGGIRQTLTEHWDGTQWTVVSSPNIPSSSNILAGVTAL